MAQLITQMRVNPALKVLEQDEPRSSICVKTAKRHRRILVRATQSCR